MVKLGNCADLPQHFQLSAFSHSGAGIAVDHRHSIELLVPRGAAGVVYEMLYLKKLRLDDNLFASGPPCSTKCLYGASSSLGYFV